MHFRPRRDPPLPADSAKGQDYNLPPADSPNQRTVAILRLPCSMVDARCSTHVHSLRDISISSERSVHRGSNVQRVAVSPRWASGSSNEREKLSASKAPVDGPWSVVAGPRARPPTRPRDGPAQVGWVLFWTKASKVRLSPVKRRQAFRSFSPPPPAGRHFSTIFPWPCSRCHCSTPSSS